MTSLEEARDLAAALAAVRAAPELSQLMEAITRETGFHCFAIVRHVKQFIMGGANPALHNYPSAWIDHYLKHNYCTSDPVFHAASRCARGFRFREIPSLIRMSDRERHVMEQSRKIGGISDGFTIPAHLPGEISISCTFVVLDDALVPEGNLFCAELVGSFACEAARRILWPAFGDGAKLEPALTTRQLECVLLVGRGKTDCEIARLLSVNEDTVTDHINEARRRYRVGRRAELPLHAVYRGDLGFGDILG